MRILIPFARHPRYIGRRSTAPEDGSFGDGSFGGDRSDDRATWADDISIRVLVGDSSRMSSQLIAAELKRSRSPRLEVLLPASFTSVGDSGRN